MTKNPNSRDDIASSMRATLGRAFPQPKHPAASGMSREARKDIFNLDPKRIVEDGFYVRETDLDDQEFGAFVEAVGARGQIDQPVSVRTAGPITNRSYILVWGKRRLHAAIKLGLEQVPVRDFGEIDETSAIKLQLQENLNRREMSPLETAVAFAELAARGEKNAEIAKLFGKTASYVSYMVKTGEALLKLSGKERDRLNKSGALKVRDCQEIAVQEKIADRVQALRALLERAPLPVKPEVPAKKAPVKHSGKGKRDDEDRPFIVRELRNGGGRSFRIRWQNQDLLENPEGFVEQLTSFLQNEVEHVINRIETLSQESGKGGEKLSADTVEHLERARNAMLNHATWLTNSRHAGRS